MVQDEVRVNGLEVLEIVNNSNIVHTTQGPFPITILPGAIHPPSSIITGVLDEYVAGETVEAVTLDHHKLKTRTLSPPSLLRNCHNVVFS